MIASKKAGNKECCSPVGAVNGGSECKVEAVISVDERGQMILPKEVREKAGINAGDKLALITWEKERKICCMVLLKVEDLTGMVKNVLGPLIGEITK